MNSAIYRMSQRAWRKLSGALLRCRAAAMCVWLSHAAARRMGAAGQLVARANAMTWVRACVFGRAQEKKVIADIKKAAKDGQMPVVKVTSPGSACLRECRH